MYTAKQAHEFAKTLAIATEKQHALGVQLALLADREYDSPADALAAIKKGQKEGKAQVAAAKRALSGAGYKDLICHRGEFISAYGWQINTRPAGNLDGHGNGRYLVAEVDQSTGKWVDVHGHPLVEQEQFDGETQ